jgi:23S rRNA (guanine2445-N2)-methyltransferase / 23S rRNA (guanine2069-N7)-methyltransferase
LSLRYFATAPRGFEDLLEVELEGLGAAGIKRRPGGVQFRGSLETGYRACLWSRLAEHVLVKIGEFPARTPDELYRGAGGILWREHLDPSKTLAVTFVSRHSRFEHLHFAALKVKDAVVDQFRSATGARPSVDTKNPDIRIHVYAEREQVTVAIDLAGAPLHRRGYRVRSLAAPLKETLAAGILMRAGLPQVLARGGALVDPMCGSGTFLVEAAWMALNFAPGRLRDRFGFMGWNGHDPTLWQRLRDDADGRSIPPGGSDPPIWGFDADAEAAAAAAANLARAGVRKRVRVETRPLSQLQRPTSGGGLVVTNPPYGERLKPGQDLEGLYRELGQVLKARFGGFQAAVLAAESTPVEAIGLRADRVHRVYNGPIRCRLLRYTLHEQGTADKPASQSGDPPVGAVEAADFANRLRKNLRRMSRWARRNGIGCYRIYDADVPEYALTIDLYQAESRWALVQEYVAPPSIDPRLARDRLNAALAAIPDVLEVENRNLVLKRRRRQRQRRQYQRLAASDDFIQVEEAGCRLLVNLKDRIDTGLYLDHRQIRMRIRQLANGRSFLNLFAYTGAATVQAAAGGARTTLSVDLSATYNEWGTRNLQLNGFLPPAHRYVRADCLEWIGAAPEAAFDLIFLDPPTFSNSKRMRRTLDVQRDHAELIRNTMRWLEPDGILFFSNHARAFRMDTDSLTEFKIVDIGAQTVPLDFRRSPRIHGCWQISHH